MRSPQDEFRTDLDKQFIDGAWRDGQHDKRLTDVNPYDGTTVAEFAMADVADTRPRRPRRHSGRRSTPISSAPCSNGLSATSRTTPTRSPK